MWASGSASVGMAVTELVSGLACMVVAVTEPVSMGIPGLTSVGMAVPEPVSVGIPGPS